MGTNVIHSHALAPWIVRKHFSMPVSSAILLFMIVVCKNPYFICYAVIHDGYTIMDFF